MDLFPVSEKCFKPVSGQCVDLNGTDCFGTPLAYSHTSIDLVTDASNLKEANKKLLLWSGLKSVPKCWQMIQPLLCSLYLPKCENGTIHLPDRSLCEQTRTPCKIVEIENDGWPDFMVCDNDKVFADRCPNAIQTKFNESECESPLMQTSNPSSWYEGVEGCGLKCMNPLFNHEEHDDMHVYIAVWASITFACTLFAMLSFFIDWKNSSKYPARIIFYINVCFFLCTFGWLAQFFQDSRNEIVCRKDGTVRLGEPVGHGESPSCVIIFVFVYFFVMSGVAWFVVLSYSWKAMFNALGTSNEPLKGKTLHFHLFAWSIAFVLLIASLSVTQIDGDSMSGICFIGYKNHWYRMGFLLVPVGLMLMAGGFYLFGGLHALVSLKHGHDGLLSESAVSKITWTMFRIGLFALFAFIFVFVTFATHVYEIVNQPLWDRSFRDYIRCEANITILEKLREEIVDPAAAGSGGCHVEKRPNIAVMKLHLFAMFGTGIVMSTWVWTKASFMNWRRAWFKLIGRSDNEMKRIRHRSRIIAKAFANRHILGRGRRKETSEQEGNDGSDNAGFKAEDLVFSEHTLTHQDPVGMDFDLNSVSQELSSSWVRNVPNIVRRRGAIMHHGESYGEFSRTNSALDVNNANVVCADNVNQDDHVMSPRRLPPVKDRRGAMVAPPAMSAEPVRTMTQHLPVSVRPHLHQNHHQVIPGFVGTEQFHAAPGVEPVRTISQHLPVSLRPQLYQQGIPGFGGAERYQTTSNFAFHDNVAVPYMAPPPVDQPYFPYTINPPDNFGYPPSMSRAIHDSRPFSKPYNLRPSTRERSNANLRKNMEMRDSSVMKQAW